MKHLREIIKEVWGEPTEADLETPFRELNRLMDGGFRKKHITVMAGVTSMGKSALGLHTLIFSARNRGKKVAFFSLEMGAKDQLARLCSNMSEGDTRPEYLKKDLESLPFWMDDNARITPLYIRMALERVNEQLADEGETPIDQICIDYVQLMKSAGGGGNRNAELDEIMGDLLALAKDLDVHVVLLAQINRNPSFRRSSGETGDARPTINDLRDSGTLENTANEIILIYRPDYYEEYPTGDTTTELIVAKNRDGAKGTAIVHFVGEEMAFHD